MELTKEIWFDTNSMPPKNMIWYRGKGKFYEWRNDVWVVAYDLGSTPSQEELNDIADIIESKTGEELQDKSLSGILKGISELATQGGDAATQHKLYILGQTQQSVTAQEALANLKLDGSTPTLSDLMNLDWRNTLVDADVETPSGQGDLILHYHTYDDGGIQSVEIRGGCTYNDSSYTNGVTWVIFITTEMDGDLPMCRVEVDWP